MNPSVVPTMDFTSSPNESQSHEITALRAQIMGMFNIVAIITSAKRNPSNPIHQLIPHFSISRKTDEKPLSKRHPPLLAHAPKRRPDPRVRSRSDDRPQWRRLHRRLEHPQGHRPRLGRRRTRAKRGFCRRRSAESARRHGGCSCEVAGECVEGAEQSWGDCGWVD